MLGMARVVDGRYTIARRLGIGGMAEVYLATDEALGREVALKVLTPALAADPAFVERFKREARAVAALNHPNIVAIYNWGEYDNTYYLVMEYVPGENLKERLRRAGALPEPDALAIAARVADALEVAHAHGLVHRDVKPHNILLAPDGRVKVTDFGIAWAAGDAQLTATNAVMGTAHYLSPEQVTHHALDGRADLYSLGVVLFEMLTDTIPFTGDTLVAVAMKQATEIAPSVRTLRPDLSPRTDAIVRTALAKDPVARFATAAAMRDALEDARHALLQPATAQTISLPTTGTVAATTVRKPLVPMPVAAGIATRRMNGGSISPPPFLPPAQSTRTRTGARSWAIPLAATVVLLTLFAVGVFAGGHLFDRRVIVATATPARAAQVIVGTPAPSSSPASTFVPTSAALPAGGILAPPAPPAPTMPTATTKPALPVVFATPLPVTAVAPAVTMPTATALLPTAVPPTQPAPTAASLPASATPLPPTAPAPPTATAPAPIAAMPPQAAADNSTPIGAVRGFYQLVSAHQFDAAATLWSARQQQQYPPASNIAGRFANTTEISLDGARIVNQTTDRATVALTITEVKQGQAPQRYSGTWQLVHGTSGWLLDQPNLQPA